MSFTRPATGNTVQADHILQLVKAWEGDSGSANRLILTQLNDSANFVVDIQNLDTTNGRGLRVRDAAGTVILQADKNGVTMSATGIVYIGTTSNANMTRGLTIAQGAADNEILSLKSSDVAHGMTSDTETDTFAYFTKSVAADGGLLIAGLTEAIIGVGLRSTVTTQTNIRSTLASGPFQLSGYKKSGLTRAALDADQNILVVTDGADTRFILDSDGDSHQDVGTAWTNFDEQDDLALLTQLSVQVSREHDPIRQSFGHFLHENRERLQALKLVSFNDGPGQDGHHFVNMSKLTMLLVGAVRQLGQRLELTEQRLTAALPGPGRKGT